MTTREHAAEILRKHAEGWRFHIGWPETHAAQELTPKKTGRPPRPSSKWRRESVLKSIHRASA